VLAQALMRMPVPIEWDEEAGKIVDVPPPDIAEEDDSSGIIAH
jgi:hypothetical protein